MGVTMKKSVLVVFCISIIFFFVSFYQTFVEFNYISVSIPFIQDLEKFTFIFNHFLVFYLFIKSIKELVNTKIWWNIITLLLPLALLIFNWYLFGVRVLVEIFD